MIELIVVMLIVGVLLTLAFGTIRSSRSGGRSLTAIATAHAYGDAIDQFAREHRGRYPTGPGTADWRIAERGPTADVLGELRYYMRQRPEPVQDGTVTWSGGGGAVLAYRQLGGGAGYELTLTVKDRPPCAVRGGNTAGESGVNDCGRR